jgi:hypothetical protein
MVPILSFFLAIEVADTENQKSISERGPTILAGGGYLAGLIEGSQ